MKQKAYFVSWHLFVLLTNYYINQSYFQLPWYLNSTISSLVTLIVASDLPIKHIKHTSQRKHLHMLNHWTLLPLLMAELIINFDFLTISSFEMISLLFKLMSWLLAIFITHITSHYFNYECII